MKFGLVLGSADSAIEDARAVEALGFDYVAAGEHVFFHEPVPSAFVALAAAAGATARVRLLSSVALLPLYAPALAAKLVATLDRVSGGRFELGVGAGGEYPAEFEACGVDLASRFRRLDEALEVIEALSPGLRISHEGRVGRIDGLALDPPPLQQPRVPVWVGGRRDGARRRAARYGDVWMPYMVTPEMLRLGLADVRARAEELARGERIRGALFAWISLDEKPRRARAIGTQVVSAMYRQDFAPLADRYLVLGTPAQAVERLEAFREAGAEATILAVAAPQDLRAHVVDLLAEHVIPALRRT